MLLFIYYNIVYALSTKNNKIVDKKLFILYNGNIINSRCVTMYENLGKYLKMRRQEMGLSLREFGKLCDMSHTHIDSIEKGVDFRSGKSVNLTGTTLSKLAAALGLSERDLMTVSSDASTDVTPVTDAQLKLALFGDMSICDDALLEIKQYAQFLKSKYPKE